MYMGNLFKKQVRRQVLLLAHLPIVLPAIGMLGFLATDGYYYSEYRISVILCSLAPAAQLFYSSLRSLYTRTNIQCPSLDNCRSRVDLQYESGRQRACRRFDSWREIRVRELVNMKMMMTVRRRRQMLFVVVDKIDQTWPCS